MEQFRRGDFVFDVIDYVVDEAPDTLADPPLNWFGAHTAE
jgi:hypothetical protein